MIAKLYIGEKRITQGTPQFSYLVFHKVEYIQRVYVRVRLYDPAGKRYQLYNQSIVLFPENNTKIPLLFYTEDQPCGFFRYEIKIFNEGLLQFTETIENDGFYIDKISVEFKKSNSTIFLYIKNHSEEETQIKVLDGNDTITTHSLSPLITETIIFENVPLSLYFANQCINLEYLINNGKVYYRHYRLFWREEDADTVFLYDPKAEGKKRLLLKKYAKYLWMISDGVRSYNLNEEEEAVMRKIMDYGIIHEISNGDE